MPTRARYQILELVWVSVMSMLKLDSLRIVVFEIFEVILVKPKVYERLEI